MRAVNIHCLGTGQGAVLTPVWEEGGVLEQGWGYPGVGIFMCWKTRENCILLIAELFQKRRSKKAFKILLDMFWMLNYPTVTLA